MSWALIKAKVYLGIGLLVAALLAALKIQSARLGKANEKNKQLGATVKKQKEVMEADFEIDEQTRSRRVDALNEIRGKNIPDAFDPNKLRKSDD